MKNQSLLLNLHIIHLPGLEPQWHRITTTCNKSTNV